MLCENCKQNQATIQLYMNINGQKQEIPLCQDCYQTVKNQTNPFSGNSPFDDIFRQLGGLNNANQRNDFQSGGRPQSTVQTQTAGNGGGLLGQYGTNLTAMARENKLDPVIGRDKEIKRVIEILNRRTKKQSCFDR